MTWVVNVAQKTEKKKLYIRIARIQTSHLILVFSLNEEIKFYTESKDNNYIAIFINIFYWHTVSRVKSHCNVNQAHNVKL